MAGVDYEEPPKNPSAKNQAPGSWFLAFFFFFFFVVGSSSFVLSSP
jgi:hypothetical protein